MEVKNDLTLVYRGELRSCNYNCPYCPFEKSEEDQDEIIADEKALDRLAAWISNRKDLSLSIFFTPWGEALTRDYYRKTITMLSRLPHVKKVAIQTNLSFPVQWLEEADPNSARLWCSYHPAQCSREMFLDQCRQLDRLEIPYSVGMVGLRNQMAEIETMRCKLPPEIYLWINAYKRKANYYSQNDVQRMEAVDPLFRINLSAHPSRGRECNTGRTIVSVNSLGTIRRCHFSNENLGNLFTDDLSEILSQRLCTNNLCGCHIGYVHMERLGLHKVFGEEILARIPLSFKWKGPEAGCPSMPLT